MLNIYIEQLQQVKTTQIPTERNVNRSFIHFCSTVSLHNLLKFLKTYMKNIQIKVFPINVLQAFHLIAKRENRKFVLCKINYERFLSQVFVFAKAPQNKHYTIFSNYPTNYCSECIQAKAIIARFMFNNK